MHHHLSGGWIDLRHPLDAAIKQIDGLDDEALGLLVTGVE